MKVQKILSNIRLIHDDETILLSDFSKIEPGMLSRVKGIEIDIGDGVERNLFKRIKGLPRLKGFFIGETDGGKRVFNLKSVNGIGNFASIVNSDEKEILKIQRNEKGGYSLIRKEFEFFKDSNATEEFAAPELSPFMDTMQEQPQVGSTKQKYDDLGNNLDILVVWTKAAECQNSDLSLKSCSLTDTTRENMMGAISLAIDETNSAFSLSGINTRLRLVHAYRHLSYEESDVTSALYDITFGYDGLKDVHDQRELYGADLVLFWTDTDVGSCGSAWVGPHKDYMYSVVRSSCATG